MDSGCFCTLIPLPSAILSVTAIDVLILDFPPNNFENVPGLFKALLDRPGFFLVTARLNVTGVVARGVVASLEIVT